MGRSTTATSYGAMADAALTSGFSVVAGGTGVLMLFGASKDFSVSGESHHIAAALLASGVGVLLIAIGALHTRRWIPRWLLAWAPAAVALLGCTNAGVQVLVTGDTSIFIFMDLGLVAAGATIPRLWILVVADAVAVATFVLPVSSLPPDMQERFIGGLIMAVWTSLVLFLYLARGRRQLSLLTEQIGHQAGHDQLTGLLNRRGLQASIQGLVEGGVPVSLGALLLDVDGFKAVNDELGHSGGDAVLRDIATMLRGLTRPADLLARIGGDEFLVLVPTDDPELLYRVAARVRAEVCGRAGVLALAWSVSVGVGLRTVGAESDVDLLTHEADLAMYDDKHRRRARPVQRPSRTVPGLQTERIAP